MPGVSCSAVRPGFSKSGQHRIDRRQLVRQFGCRRDVLAFGREVVDTVVAKAELRLELLHRQQLDGAHAKIGEVAELLCCVEEGCRLGWIGRRCRTGPGPTR